MRGLSLEAEGRLPSHVSLLLRDVLKNPISQFYFGVVLFLLAPLGLPSLLPFQDRMRLGLIVGGSAALVGVGFIFGRMLLVPQSRSHPGFQEELERLLRRTVLWAAAPAIAVAVRFYLLRSGVAYGEGEGIGKIEQGVLYFHLYAYFAYLCVVDSKRVKGSTFLFISLLAMFPRLLIATKWGRFFIVQAFMPFLWVGIREGYLRASRKLLFGLVFVFFAVFFLLPKLRGDEVSLGDRQSVIRFIATGGPVALIDEVPATERAFPETNFLKTGLVGNVFPMVLSRKEVADLWGVRNLPVTADRAFALMEGGDWSSLTGPGSVYVAELLLIGGWAAVVVGSIIMGLFAGASEHIKGMPLCFALPLMDFVSKLLFVPRSDFTYLFEMWPFLWLLGWVFSVVAAWRFRAKREGQALGEM